MSRLPTVNNCTECGSRKHDPRKVSVFQRIGPMPPQDKRAKPSCEENFEGEKISITSRAGALTDLVVLKNAGYSDYAFWRKPMPSTLRC
jgi:hypothetical protein